MKGLAIICALCLGCASASAEIYRWLNEEGQVHFSDRDPGKGEPVEVFDSRHDGIKPVETPASRPKVRSGKPRRGEKVITADDYRISAEVNQKRDLVCISGRISEGPPCKRLKLDFYVQDGAGHLLHLIDIAEDLGGFMSDLLETSRRVKYGDSRSHWRILSISATCLQSD
jgi:hypothetical protein